MNSLLIYSTASQWTFSLFFKFLNEMEFSRKFNQFRILSEKRFLKISEENKKM